MLCAAGYLRLFRLCFGGDNIGVQLAGEGIAGSEEEEGADGERDAEKDIASRGHHRAT